MLLVLEEMRANRSALEEVKALNTRMLSSVDAFFRSTPKELRQLSLQDSAAVLRSLILVSEFVPLHEAARVFASSASNTGEGAEVRREVSQWLRQSDLLQEQAALTRSRASRVDQLIAEHAVGGAPEV